jgi:hypothetical protein
MSLIFDALIPVNTARASFVANNFAPAVALELQPGEFRASKWFKSGRKPRDDSRSRGLIL